MLHNIHTLVLLHGRSTIAQFRTLWPSTFLALLFMEPSIAAVPIQYSVNLQPSAGVSWFVYSALWCSVSSHSNLFFLAHGFTNEPTLSHKSSTLHLLQLAVDGHGRLLQLEPFFLRRTSMQPATVASFFAALLKAIHQI